MFKAKSLKRTPPPPITSARWGTRTKRIVGIFLFLGFIAGLIIFADVIPLLIIAALLSYLLWPLVNFFEHRFLWVLPFGSRSLAVLMTFLIVIAGFAVSLVLIIPVLVDQVALVGESLPLFLADLEAEARRVLSQPLSFGGSPVLIDGEPLVPLDQLEQLSGANGEAGSVMGENFDLMQFVGTFLGSLTGPAFSVLGGAITAIINVAFLIVIMFYVMRDGDKFINHVIRVTPSAYQGDARRLFFELGRVWNAYLRGQLMLCIIVGMAVYIAALVLGLPSAPILGVIAGFLEFVPNIGPIIATIPAVLVALVSTSSTIPFLSGLPFALVVIAIWTLIQQLESIYLVPRVMGGNLDLHPVVVLISVLAGASAGGALGVILAAPFMATARVFGQYFYGKLFDSDPFVTIKPYEVANRQPGVIRLTNFFRYVFTRRTTKETSTPMTEITTEES